MSHWDIEAQSDEWYTPKAVFDALGCRFDLDATPARYGTPEGARKWIVREENLRFLAHQEQTEKAKKKNLPLPPAFEPRVIPDNLKGSSHVPADRLLEGDALFEPWEGFVWLNPPFGGRNGIEPWLIKFFEHGNGIALMPDRTSAPWFWRAWNKADLVLFTRKIRFIRPDGTEGVSPSNGTALMAKGEKGQEALRRAADVGFGILARPQADQAA